MRTLFLLYILYFVFSPAGAQTDVLQTARLTNDYFMAKYSDPTIPTNVKRIRPSSLWTRAVYYEGLMALNAIDPQERYVDYALRWADFHQWTPRNGTGTTHADDQCCSQTYIELNQLTGKGTLEPTKENLQKQMATGRADYWTWIDAIQMGLPVLTKMSRMQRLRGDADWARYAEQGWQMYRASRDSIAGGLFNRKHGLWWRDKDFVPPFTTPNGKQCYWSRGNGWVYAALVRAMETLPQDPHYNDYLKDYLQMTKALLKRRQADGYWYVSLDDPQDFGGKELTGTALFIYGMAWGVRTGVLPANKFCPIIYETWNNMVKDCLHADGALGYVQGTGKEPKDSQPVTYDKEPDFDDYGLGCFLLCGTEVYKLLNR